jgi:hypothetical protein
MIQNLCQRVFWDVKCGNSNGIEIKHNGMLCFRDWKNREHSQYPDLWVSLKRGRINISVTTRVPGLLELMIKIDKRICC